MSDKQRNSGAPERSGAESSSSNIADNELLMYANDVQVVVDAGDVHLIFTRTRPLDTVAKELTQRSDADQFESEVIARVVLPSRAADRLLRLLPRGRADQSEISAVAQTESEDLNDDPFVAALAVAEFDDEPYTDEQRAAALAGWEACQRGETVPWEEVRRLLLGENEASKTPTS